MIEYKCGCGKEYTLNDELAGTFVECYECKGTGVAPFKPVSVVPPSVPQPARQGLQFFSVSPIKFAVLFVSTLGIYQVYWFYRNWKIIKKQESSSIWPWARALFCGIYAYPLFKKVSAATETFSYDDKFSAMKLFLFYDVTLLVGRKDPTGLTVFLTLVPLLKIQKAINFNNAKIDPASLPESKFTAGSVLGVILGLLFWTFVIFGWLAPG